MTEEDEALRRCGIPDDDPREGMTLPVYCFGLLTLALIAFGVYWFCVKA